MKNKLSLAIACGLATMCLATTGFANEKTFNIGGDVELDITGVDDEDSSSFTHGGRIKLNAVGMVTNNAYFAKGVAQPLVLFNPGDVVIEQETEENLKFNANSIEVDDLYFQVGKTNSWDIQIGRFEAANLFPLGKDTLVVNAGGVQVYSASDARGRKDDALHVALHVGSADRLQFELGVMGNKSGDDKFTAVRPVVTYNLGNVKLHAGFETINTNGDDNTGFGLGAGFKVAGGDVNLSVARLEVDNSDTDVTSLALNYTKGPFGIGYIHSGVHSDGIPNDPKVDTVYAAYTLPLFSLKDASVTFAGSTSTAKNPDVSTTAARVRFNYTF